MQLPCVKVWARNSLGFDKKNMYSKDELFVKTLEFQLTLFGIFNGDIQIPIFHCNF